MIICQELILIAAKYLQLNDLVAYPLEVPRRFGENLIRLRRARKLTQVQLAKALKLKQQGQISLWETGNVVPAPRTIRRLAQALDCEPWELLEDVEIEYDLLRLKTAAPRTRVR